MRAPVLLPALVLMPVLTVALSGCGPSDNDPGPGGVTVGEARALDEAAAMIDQRRTPAEAIAGEPAEPVAGTGAASTETAPAPEGETQ